MARRYCVYLDVLRCIAVYLVILAHSITGILVDGSLFATPVWWVANLLSIVVRVSIPLFFMISGYLSLTDPRTDNVVEFYKRRLGKLIPPFLVWDLIYFVYKSYADGNWSFSLQVFVQDLVSQGSAYHLWFVYQMAALYLLMPFLKRIVDHSDGRELLIFLAVILLQPTVFRLLNLVQTWVAIAPFLSIVEGYAGFLLVGYLLGTRDLSPRTRRWIYVLGLVGLVGGAYGNYACSEPASIQLYGNEGYFITHYMTASACFVLVKQTAEKFPGWLKKAAGKLSGLTFGIYFAHVLILELACAVLNRTVLAGIPLLKAAVLCLSTGVITTVFIRLASRVNGLKKLLM